MAKLYDLARMTTATVGTGTITLGAAIPGCLTFANAGVQNGDVVSYGIQDGSNSEVGRGTYTTAGTTLTRNVIVSTNANNPIALSGNAQVFITVLNYDVNTLSVFDFMTPAQIADVTAGTLLLDHTTPVANAINFVNSLGGGTKPFNVLQFPPGNYSITPGSLPLIYCDIDGPRATLTSNSNVAADLLPIGLPPGYDGNQSQHINLYALTAFGFTYTFGATRYNYGISFGAAATKSIGSIQIDIGYIQGFDIAIHLDVSGGNFHIGENTFNISNLFYNRVGIFLVTGAGAAATIENNIFNVIYMTGLEIAIYCNSVNGGIGNCTQNIFNVGTLEIGRPPGAAGIGIQVIGNHTQQNTFNFFNLSWQAVAAIVDSDTNPWGNEYNLPTFDPTLLINTDNDIVKVTGVGFTGVSPSNGRSIVYGNSPAPVMPSRSGDRYIVNNPTGYGPASYVRSSGSWTVETSAGNVQNTGFTSVITPSATPGTFTSTTNGTYNVVNGVCYFSLSIAISTNGTGAGYLQATLPITPATHIATICGRETSSGKMLQGLISAGSSIAQILNYDNTYPGGNVATLYVSGQYSVG